MCRLLAFTVLTGLVVILAVGPEPSAAQGKKVPPWAKDGIIEHWGMPPFFDRAKANAVWLWHADGIWYLRTTSATGSHRFRGRVVVDAGRFDGIRGLKGEKAGPNPDRFRFNRERTILEFDFKTDGGVDGLNFSLDPAATGMKVTLEMDGEASPRHIRIGRGGDLPAEATFTLPAHPVNDPAAKAKAKGKKKK